MESLKITFIFSFILWLTQPFILFSMDVVVEGPVDQPEIPSKSAVVIQPAIVTPAKIPFLIDVSTRFLRSYKEHKIPSEFEGTPVLTNDEIEKNNKRFFLNFNTYGYHAPWIDFDFQLVPYEEFKHPYVQKITIPVGSKVCFIGDLHGSLHSLLRNLWRLVALGYLNKNLKIIKPNFHIILLGDYVDRGCYGMETLYTLIKLKNKNWHSVFIIRGNHETKKFNEASLLDGGGFFNELAKKYPDPAIHLNIFAQTLIFYQRLPLALYVNVGENTFMCTHGGVSVFGYYFDEKCKDLIKSKTKNYRYLTLEKKDKETPGYQWCDFVQSHGGTLPILADQERVWKIEADAIKDLFEEMGIQVLFRGHQHTKFGLKMLFSNEQLAVCTEPVHEQDSGLYHWATVLKTVNPLHLEEHAKRADGFSLNGYLPIFTFASAPESVGVEYDCFGILTTSKKFSEWQLKVYEFGFPPKTSAPDSAWYVSIKRRTPSLTGEVPLGTGNIPNPTAEFYDDATQPTLEELMHNFDEF